MAIDHDEFNRWMELLRDDIHGVHDRLDRLNGRTRENEQAIAVLQDRGVRATDAGARWIGGLAAAGGIVMELLHRIWGTK